MSVTVEGVQGYEYQYKVTVLLALLNDDDNTELFVESKGIEDAYLILKENGETTNIEIQVKREKNILDIKKITEWLCHFEARKSNNNLLSILENSANTKALFVTYSRCSDETVVLKTEFGSLISHNESEIKIKTSDWLKSIKTINFSKKIKGVLKETSLSNRRGEFCIEQAKRTTSSLLELLSRVTIWEEINDEKIDSKIIGLLNARFKISQSKCKVTYLHLFEDVKKGRNNRINILPLVRKTLLMNKIGSPNLTKGYIKRKEEEVLIGILGIENVLLLSGVSQCGKSELAKRIAIEFCSKGFDYKHTNEINDVKIFYSTNPEDNKVVVLEDPWGHTKVKDNSRELLRTLESIIINSEQHHKLIITSRSEILLGIYTNTDIQNCKIVTYSWNDLVIHDVHYLNNYWRQLATNKGIDKDTIELVCSNCILQSDKHDILQLGQLNYLANIDISIFKGKSYKDLEHIARYNSADIARNLQEKDSRFANMLAVLAICSSTIVSVNIRELAYIYAEHVKESSIIDKTFSTISSSYMSVSTFPEYSQKYQLNDNLKEALEYLEERQFVNRSGDEIRFSHPNYYEAGRILFFAKTASKQLKFLGYMKRSLFCLNPNTAFIATNQFSFIYENIHADLKVEVIQMAFFSINSIFPKVEDESLIFLQNHISKLLDDERTLLIGKIQRGGTPFSNIHWEKNEVPYISNKSGFLNNRYIKEDLDVLHDTEILLNKECMVSAYDVWVFLDNFDSKANINRKIINTILQYDEVFIRNKVVNVSLKNNFLLDRDVISMFFNDKHPSVIFSTIRALLTNWVKYKEEDKKFLFPLIKNSLKEVPVSIRAYNLFATFSCDYGSEGIYVWRDLNEVQKQILWNIWGKLYPIVVDNIPLGLNFNTGRFGVTMDEACRYLDKEIGIIVIEAWFKRIDHQLLKGEELDSHQTAVADCLMTLTKKDDKIRRDLFNRIISYEDIRLLLPSLRWIVQYWNLLSNEEKRKILNLIDSDNKDRHWIKAVVLTACTPPHEIVNLIFGEENLFEKETKYIISKFPNELLKDCICLFYGKDNIGIEGLNRSNAGFWSRIIKEILLNQYHFLFNFCVEEFLNNGVNGSYGEIEDGIKIWKQICSVSGNLNSLADTLIYLTASCNYCIEPTHDFWIELINCYTIRDKENEIIMKIADNIELLQYSGDRGDIIEVLGKEFILKKIIPELDSDSLIISYLKIMYSLGVFSENEKVEWFMRMYSLFENYSIRFFGTYNIINNTSDYLPEEIIKTLSNLPNNIVSIGKEKLNKLEQERNQYYDNSFIK